MIAWLSPRYAVVGYLTAFCGPCSSNLIYFQTIFSFRTYKILRCFTRKGAAGRKARMSQRASLGIVHDPLFSLRNHVNHIIYPQPWLGTFASRFTNKYCGPSHPPFRHPPRRLCLTGNRHRTFTVAHTNAYMVCTCLSVRALWRKLLPGIHFLRASTRSAVAYRVDLRASSSVKHN